MKPLGLFPQVHEQQVHDSFAGDTLTDLIERNLYGGDTGPEVRTKQVSHIGVSIGYSVLHVF